MGDNSVFPQLLCYTIGYHRNYSGRWLVATMSASKSTSTIVYYVIKYCVLKVVLDVFVMFCIDDNPLFGFLDQYKLLLLLLLINQMFVKISRSIYSPLKHLNNNRQQSTQCH